MMADSKKGDREVQMLQVAIVVEMLKIQHLQEVPRLSRRTCLRICCRIHSNLGNSPAAACMEARRKRSGRKSLSA